MAEIREVHRMASYKLMIPGPVDVEDEVLSEMASPVVAHYGDAWVEIYLEVVDCLKRVFQTENDLFIMGGPGSAALDASFGSLLATGEKVLIPSNGFFGQRLRTMARSYGLEVVPLDFPLEQAISASAVEAQLQKEKGIRAVAVVHHETSTGVLNPLPEIAAVTKEAGVPIIVDAVASLGGVPLPVDEWGIDLCITVPNKCLAAPPGISLLSVSQRAWEMIESTSDRPHGWYLNLQTWKRYATEWASWHPYPTTMATNNVLALLASLRQLLAEGLETRYARTAKAAEMTREGLTDMGFEMFIEGPHASPLITAAKGRPDMSIAEMAQFLRDERGIMIGGGIDELAGKIFRVGHMGRAILPAYIEAFLAGVRDFFQGKGLEKV
jgi:alanine-glyoxylate transaminase/serine-glyoxylate transaminase/serine-pyruvate transaminase